MRGHLVGFAASGARMVRGRLTYGNDEVVHRFVDAVLGDHERIRWMTADDGHAVVACLEEIVRPRRARAGCARLTMRVVLVSANYRPSVGGIERFTEVLGTGLAAAWPRGHGALLPEGSGSAA